MAHRILLLGSLASCLLARAAPAEKGVVQHSALWTAEASENGYRCYRVPAITKLKNGEIMVAIEGRRHDCNDHGWVDIVSKKSADGGLSWTEEKVILGESTTGMAEQDWVTVGNANPIPLADGGVLLVGSTKGNKEFFTMRAANDDATAWERPPRQIPLEKYTGWVGSGPSAGLELPSGRLLVCCYASVGEKRSRLGQFVADHYSFALISDDQGQTWRPGAGVYGGHECHIARGRNGSLVMNSRTISFVRQFASSGDEGETWSTPTSEPFPEKIGNHGWVPPFEPRFTLF